MATIEKISSGMYRIRKQYEGKLYLLTVKKRPSKAEADKLIFSYIESSGSSRKKGDKTFSDYAEEYISGRNAILSPSTIRGYRNILRNMSESFKNKPVERISQSDIQILLNDKARRFSGKTVRNLSGFVSAVMKFCDPSFRYDVVLPQKRSAEFYVPEEDDVKKLLAYVKGSKYEIAIWLGAFGLRRSEICALTPKDLDGNEIIVNKTLLYTAESQWTIVHATKTTESRRRVTIPDYVCGLIRELPEDQRLFTLTPDRISDYMRAAEADLGIEHFSLHKLRHYFASTASEIMPPSYVCSMGGWKRGSSIMQKVYDYSQKQKEKRYQDDFVSKFSSLMDS